MKRVVITGSSGLVGSECVRHFDRLGWSVLGLDNGARGLYFGADGDVAATAERLMGDLLGYRHVAADVRDFPWLAQLVAEHQPDLIIHAAAQPSHDWAAGDPLRDFSVNARGTLNLLEAARQHAPEAVFVFLSTNKVYGDAPNRRPLVEMETRFELDGDAPEACYGFGEWLATDGVMHSLFGCSKLAADLYVQEYGRYFGLRTCCLRCGCLTGGAHAAAEQHGFLAYLVRCCKEGRPYTVHGYKGKQVRDNLHARDVARAIEEVYAAPRAGEVYNLGGGRANSCSVWEAIALAEAATAKKLDCSYSETPRRGDHIVWITDNGKFVGHYPGWLVRVSLPEIFAELAG